MSAVAATEAAARGLKLRDALSAFRKVYSSASEKARKVPEKVDKVNWDYWKKEIRAPGVVDQLKTLSEAGPEETRMTPQLASAVRAFGHVSVRERGTGDGCGFLAH